MDDPVPYVPTAEAMLLGLKGRVDQLEEMLRHIDRHSLDLLRYVETLEGLPGYEEWTVVVDLIREVRNGFQLGASDR